MDSWSTRSSTLSAIASTQVLFEPLDFIARLAALVPRPRSHLVRYHGLFAPHAKHRHYIVDSHPSSPAPEHTKHTSESLPTAPMTWMQRATPACSRST